MIKSPEIITLLGFTISILIACFLYYIVNFNYNRHRRKHKVSNRKQYIRLLKTMHKICSSSAFQRCVNYYTKINFDFFYNYAVECLVQERIILAQTNKKDDFRRLKEVIKEVYGIKGYTERYKCSRFLFKMLNLLQYWETTISMGENNEELLSTNLKKIRDLHSEIADGNYINVLEEKTWKLIEKIPEENLMYKIKIIQYGEPIVIDTTFGIENLKLKKNTIEGNTRGPEKKPFYILAKNEKQAERVYHELSVKGNIKDGFILDLRRGGNCWCE